MFIAGQAPIRTGHDVIPTVERPDSIIRWRPERNSAREFAHVLWIIAIVALVTACVAGSLALYV